MIKYHVFYAELMCLCELISPSRLNSKISWILSYLCGELHYFTLQTQAGRGHISYRITGKSQTKRKNRKNTIVKVGKA